MSFILLSLLAYLLGSIPFGKIIAARSGKDIQKEGSGNIGFANSIRVLEWKKALPVLIGDTLKGYIPTILALHFLPIGQVYIIAFLAFLGHIFPVWLKFKGGKGIATGLGITLAISPIATLLALIVFILIFLCTKIMSVSSLSAALILPICIYFLSPSYTLLYICLFIISLWTHRTNIMRLIKGTEKKIL